MHGAEVAEVAELAKAAVAVKAVSVQDSAGSVMINDTLALLYVFLVIQRRIAIR